jgi:hypothetical protein
MAALYQRRFRVSAIGGTSFTLTPCFPHAGSAGAHVDGGIPAGDPDISSGITTIVVNSTGAPDSNFARHVNQIVLVDLQTEN